MESAKVTTFDLKLVKIDQDTQVYTNLITY